MSKARDLRLFPMFCIFWPLGKLLKFRPAWYLGRAAVGLFGYTVIGQPGKQFFVASK